MFVRSTRYQFGPSGAGSIGEASAYQTVQGVRQQVEGLVERVKSQDNSSNDVNHDPGKVILHDERLAAELVYRPDGSIERFGASDDKQGHDEFSKVHTYRSYRAEDQGNLRKFELSTHESRSYGGSIFGGQHESWKLEVDRQSGAISATHEEEVDAGRPPELYHDDGEIGTSAIWGGVIGALPLFGVMGHAIGIMGALSDEAPVGYKVACTALGVAGAAVNLAGMFATNISAMPFLISGAIGAVEGGLLQWAHESGEYSSQLQSYEDRLKQLRSDPDIKEV